MKLLKAIASRHSVRAYAPGAVEAEKLEAVVQAGNLAPVFGRLHITVIEDGQLLREINDVTLEMMRRSGDKFLEKRAASPGYAPLYGAPAMIVLSALNGNDSHGFNMANVSCAAENMIIEATELGLGTCFVMGPMMAFANPQLVEKCRIPAGHVPLVGVLLGHPQEGTANAPRNVPDNVTYLK